MSMKSRPTNHDTSRQAPLRTRFEPGPAADDPVSHQAPVQTPDLSESDRQVRSGLAWGGVLAALILIGFLIVFSDVLWMVAGGVVLFALAWLVIWLFRRGYLGIGFWF